MPTMSDITKYSLPELVELETNPKLLLSQFNNEVAWKLGSYARQIATEQYPNRAIVIDISTTNGHRLFHTTIGSGTVLNNDHWIDRKRNTVQRFGFSSYYMGRKLEPTGKSMQEGLFISPIDYAIHGGSIALKVVNCDYLVGTFTVSGLAQEEDHLLALEVLENFNSMN